MRRQTVGRVHPAGSSREQRLDPPTLLKHFNARDERADGGLRQVEITRDRIIIKRVVQSIRMMLKVRIADYFAITLRAATPADNLPGAWVLWLEHRDRALSVPLIVSNDAEEIGRIGAMWCEFFGRPDLIETGGVGTMPDPLTSNASPAPRRRRRNAVRNRRPRFLVRRQPGAPKVPQPEETFREEDVEDLGLL